MVAIFDPAGRLISGTMRKSRKEARRDFVADNDAARWADLWALGYRVRRVV